MVCDYYGIRKSLINIVEILYYGIYLDDTH